MVVATLSSLPVNGLLAQGQSPRWPLTFAATTDALAIVAARLVRVVSTLSPWWLRLMPLAVVLSLLV
jgi:hypothetical protein